MNNKFFITVLAALLGSNALCAAEHILVASSGSHSLEEFDTSGNWTRTFATTGPYAPVAIAQSPKTGEIFVTTEVDPSRCDSSAGAHSGTAQKASIIRRGPSANSSVNHHCVEKGLCADEDSP